MRHSYKTTELCVLQSAALVPLHRHCCSDFFILVSLGLSVPAESFSFVPLGALRQSCTEWWLSERIAAQPAAGPPWWVSSRVSEEGEEMKQSNREHREGQEVTQRKVKSFLTRSEVLSGAQLKGHTGVLVASGKQATALMYSFKSRSSNWFTSP